MPILQLSPSTQVTKAKPINKASLQTLLSPMLTGSPQLLTGTSTSAAATTTTTTTTATPSSTLADTSATGTNTVTGTTSGNTTTATTPAAAASKMPSVATLVLIAAIGAIGVGAYLYFTKIQK